MKFSLNALGLAFALALTGAAMPASAQDGTEPWMQNIPKRNQVELVRFSHDVSLDPRDFVIGSAEQDALARFFQRIQLTYGDEVAIDAGDSPNSDLREVAVRSYLNRLGIKAVAGDIVSGEAPAPNEVRIVVGRYIVTTPPCPDWRKNPVYDYKNRIGSNLGCATVTNLGLMVANPRDLVIGEDGLVPDTPKAAEAVNKYRIGEVEEPDEVRITVMESRGGGGQ